MTTKKISARELVADIRAGMSGQEIMKKYEVSIKGLRSLLDKLLEANLLTRAEYDRHLSGTESAGDTIPRDRSSTPKPAQPLPKENFLEILEYLAGRFEISGDDLDKLRTALAEGVKELTDKYHIPTDDVEGLLKSLGISNKSYFAQVSGYQRKQEPIQLETVAPHHSVSAPEVPNGAAGGRRLRRLLARCAASLNSIFGTLRELLNKKSSDQAISKSEPAETIKAAIGPKGPQPELGTLPSRKPKLGFVGRIKALPAAIAGFAVSLLTGKFLLKLAAYIVVLGLFLLSSAVIIQRHELNLYREAQALVRIDPLQKAEELYKAGEICDALEHLEYFMDFDYVKENPEVKKFHDKIKSERDSWLFRTKQVGTGIWKGKGACPEAIYSATASDLVGVGSVRTLAEWGLDKYHGNETDDFAALLAGVDVLATSIVAAGIGGTAATGGMAAPAGAVAVAVATPVKTTVTSIRITHKLGKLPAPLRAALARVLQQTIKMKSLEPIKGVTKSLNRIKDVPGLKGKDFFTVIAHTKDLKDLERMSHVTTTFGVHTGKFLKLGKEKSLQIYDKFHGDPHLVPGLNQAVQYGDKGTNLLMKTGPQRFLKIVAPNQAAMTVRTLRSLWEGHLTRVLMHILKLIPEWAIFSIAACSGLFVIGIPSAGVYRAWRSLRTPA